MSRTVTHSSWKTLTGLRRLGGCVLLVSHLSRAEPCQIVHLHCQCGPFAASSRSLDPMQIVAMGLLGGILSVRATFNTHSPELSRRFSAIHF
jgi:hypothetical protein